MFMMRSIVLAAIFGALAISVWAEDSPVAGTMPEDVLPQLKPILASAVERSPSTIGASLDLAVQQANLYFAESSLWPNLNGGANYSGDRASVSGGAPSTEKGLFYYSTLNQPIFEWGAFKWQADIGKLAVKISEKNFGEAYRTLAVTIRLQYLALVAKRIGLRNARYKLQIELENQAVFDAKKKAGAASQAELIAYQLLVDDNKLAVERLTEDFRLAKLTFMRLCGLTDLPDDSIPMAIPGTVFHPELADSILRHFIGGGVQSTFQARIFDLQIREDDLNYRIARTRLLPKFNGTLGYFLSNSQTAIPGSAGNPGSVSQAALKTISYGVGGSWQIFDGFATRGAKLAALVAKRQVQLQRKNYVDTTVDLATSFRFGLDIASRDGSLIEERGDLLKAALDKAQGDVKVGLASPASLKTVTLKYYVSELDRANGRIGFFSYWTQFVGITDTDPAMNNIPYRYVR